MRAKTQQSLQKVKISWAANTNQPLYWPPEPTKLDPALTPSLSPHWRDSHHQESLQQWRNTDPKTSRNSSPFIILSPKRMNTPFLIQKSNQKIYQVCVHPKEASEKMEGSRAPLLYYAIILVKSFKWVHIPIFLVNSHWDRFTSKPNVHLKYMYSQWI